MLDRERRVAEVQSRLTGCLGGGDSVVDERLGALGDVALDLFAQVGVEAFAGE
jgi:hypothetical protein